MEYFCSVGVEWGVAGHVLKLGDKDFLFFFVFLLIITVNNNLKIGVIQLNFVVPNNK